MHIGSITPKMTVATPARSAAASGAGPVESAVAAPPDQVQRSRVHSTSGLASSNSAASTQGASAGLFAPGALVTVAQVTRELSKQGVEFRELTSGWLRGERWRGLEADGVQKSLQRKRPLEYRVDQGEWVRVANVQQLAQVLAGADLSAGGQVSGRAQGLAASAQAGATGAALAAAGGAGAAAVARPAAWSCPFKLLVDPPRIGTLPFATGILGHVKNPVKFFDEFHGKHGDHFMVELPTGQRFLFDHRAESVHEALKVTDSPKLTQTWHKPELQGHGLSFLMGMDNVFLGKGEEWKKTHEVIKPHLHGSAINTDGATAQVGQIVERHIQGIKDQIRQQGGEAQVDFRTTMQRATLDVAMQLVLGTELNDRELQETQEAFQKAMQWLTLETANPTDFSLSRLPGNGELRKAYQQLQGLADRVIAEHRANPKDTMVSSLLHAVDPETGRPFSDERVRNEILTLMLAGHETTATLLSWSFAEMSRRPDLWGKLQGEVDQKLEGRFPSYKDIKGLTQVDATVDETLRLYSPAYFLVREATQDTTLGPPDATVHAPKGTQLVMSTYHMQRDPEAWGKDSEEFRPDRFQDKESPKGRMYPFGSGIRVCMGQHLAKLEANLILTRFAQEFDIVGNPGAEIGIESDVSVHPADATLTMRVREGGPEAQGPPPVPASAGKCPFMANLDKARQEVTPG